MKPQNAGSTKPRPGKKLEGAPLPKAPPRLERRKWWRVRSGTLGRLLLISVIVFVVAGITWDRLAPSTWAVPLQYEGDTQQLLGWIKGASEFDYVPFASKTAHRLGAPFNANWNDYAMYEEILTFLLGLAAKCAGLMQASNLGILLSYLPSALAFYACCRMLRYARAWSFAGAILFGFTFYNSRRLIFHLLLSFSYVIPLSLLVCWLVLASKRLRPRGPWFWFCVGISFLMGLSNPYSLNIFLQLLCFSIALNWWRNRDKTRLKIGLLCLAMAVAGFLAVNLDTLSYAHFHGSNPAATPRNYAQTEMAALKPMEMVIPPANHNVDFLGAIGQKYASVALVKGELFSPYLGIVGILSLLWMGGEFLWLLLNRRNRNARIPAHMLQCVWILGYSVIGGLNNIFALAGLYLFRSTNRYSIFISALCLFFLVSRMSLLTRRWSAEARWALAVGIMLFGLFDQLPKPATREETLRVSKLVETDTAFCSAMENALPKGGMVFQLPVMRFPEGGPVGAVTEYEMLRPYFFTRTLRFSFGSNQGRPREDWQFAVEKLPAPQMAATLEKYGFSAIYINRRGFSDGAEGLLKNLAAAGKTKLIEDDRHEQICIALNPSQNPELPRSDRLLTNFKRGWVVEERTPEQSRHWAGGNATIRFFNEQKGGSSCHLTCLVATLSPRRVEIEFAGKKIWGGELASGQLTPVDVWLDAKHGNNTLNFKTDAPAMPPEKNANVAVAFAAINVQVVTESSGK